VEKKWDRSDIPAFELSLVSVPYKLAYKSPLCGPCETNALSQEGTYSKGIYYGRWSVRHTNFAATLLQEGTYKPGGLIAKGGLIC
jgi:hypothetical protein